MAKTRPGMMFYFEDWDIPRKILDHIQFKVLFDALYDYARDGVIPDMIPDDTVRVFFDTFRQKVDRDAERYNDTCRKRSEAGKRLIASKSRHLQTKTAIASQHQPQTQIHIQHQRQTHIHIKNNPSTNPK